MRLSMPPKSSPPTPAGTPVTTHSSSLPTESPALRASRMARFMSKLSSLPVAWPTRTALAVIVMPRRSRICRQTAPANTRHAVSRPLNGPPPRRSAWPPKRTVAA